ncbi:bifunctional protein GlmU [Roseibium aquae]|uniref:Bifunctional protein GlmU n=2 Tax=Roseibium aquae TaxID=1323746 RepID=A0A916TPL4_9HYPH|nr:bifunctional protein GlmU [Roseibium aquae]
MRSSRAKVLHEIGGLSLVGHVLTALRSASVERIAVVVGPQMEDLENQVRQLVPEAGCYVQNERLGTAHAALAARPALEAGADDVLVLFGDTPLVSPETILRVREQLAQGADVAVLGFEAQNPAGYGRLLVEGGRLVAIREDKDATLEEKAVTFCNSGIMGFCGKAALELLDAIGNANAKGEFYLTDAVEIANSRGLTVQAVEGSEDEVQGINTRAQLARCEAVFQARKRAEAMENGVTLQAPETVHFSHDTVLGEDVVVEPNVVFGPGVKVQPGARIRAFSHLEGASVGTGCTVGPFARLRPGASLSPQAHVGNFVEIKNATIGQGAKVNHLSYVGDASVGSAANIGAGTITCNYDGFSKHRTEIGAKSFIGSNSTLVAPVSIGPGSYVGAGSTVTDNVPGDSLVIGRGRQVIKQGRAKTLRARLQAAKDGRK